MFLFILVDNNMGYAHCDDIGFSLSVELDVPRSNKLGLLLHIDSQYRWRQIAAYTQAQVDQPWWTVALGCFINGDRPNRHDIRLCGHAKAQELGRGPRVSVSAHVDPEPQRNSRDAQCAGPCSLSFVLV
jgi:hypothetical protein